MIRKSHETISEVFGRLILDSSQRIFRAKIARTQKKRYIILAAFMLAVLSFVFYSLFVVADVFNFYPTSCLGTWEKPENAQSKPELNEGASSQDFNETNSAVFRGGVRQIFCGGFRSDEESSGKIFKKAVLKFSWTMIDIPLPALEQSKFEEKLLEFEPTEEIIVVPNAMPLLAASQSQSPEPSLIPKPTIIPTVLPATANPEFTPEPSPSQIFEENLGRQATPTPTPEPTLTQTPLPNSTSSPQTIPTAESPATSSFHFSGRLFAVVDEASSTSESTDSSNNKDSPPSFLEALLERVIEIKNLPLTTTEPSLVSPSHELATESVLFQMDIIPGTTSTPTSEISPDNKLLPDDASVSTEISSAIASDSVTVSPLPEYNLTTSSLENFFEILFSTDGQNWNLIANVNQRNFHGLEVPLPINSGNDLENFQVMINVLPSDHNLPQVFLDSVWIETQYEDIQQKIESETNESIKEEIEKLPQIKIDASEIIKQSEGKSDFGADEEPAFEINTNFSPSAFPSGSPSPIPSILLPLSPTGKIKAPIVLTWLVKLLKPRPARAQSEDQILVEVFDWKGEKTDIQPITENVNGKIITRLPKSRALRPGKFELRVIIIKNNIAYLTSQNFTWGMVAINFDKSIYLPNQTARFAITVLDKAGAVVCNAEIVLEVTNQVTNQIERFSTTGGGIIINPECHQKKMTTKPDYEIQYRTDNPGFYGIKVVAISSDGARIINDRFEVREEVAFDIQRIVATRIFPSRPYLVRLMAKANQNFSGQIVDYIPASFDIKNVSGGGRVENGKKGKMIIWETELKKGEIYEFSYDYLAPDISPQFYLLGPLDLGAFSEIKKWQITADEPGPRPPPKTSLVNRCRVEPFPITISGRELTPAKIVFFGEEDIKEVEIGFGDLPLGIDVRFSQNSGHLYQISGSESVLDLEITKQEGSQRGDFSIAIVYNKITDDPLIACQMNLINY